MAARLRLLLPSNWFPAGPLPVLDAVLAGPASAMAWAYSLLTWVGQQMRLPTSAGGMIDLFAYDFFGYGLLRRAGETDTAYIARIQANLFQPRNTRAALVTVLTALTGRAPLIMEPMRAADTGGWTSGYLGWSTYGRVGSLENPYQFFVTAYRPLQVPTGAAWRQGFGNLAAGVTWAIGGWATRLLGYVSSDATASGVSDADIYAAIAAVIPAGTIAWTYISD